jgi:hypothetical protein
MTLRLRSCSLLFGFGWRSGGHERVAQQGSRTWRVIGADG